MYYLSNVVSIEKDVIVDKDHCASIICKLQEYIRVCRRVIITISMRKVESFFILLVDLFNHFIYYKYIKMLG